MTNCSFSTPVLNTLVLKTCQHCGVTCAFFFTYLPAWIYPGKVQEREEKLDYVVEVGSRQV